jgi:broad specificity phosphatase PhoE
LKIPTFLWLLAGRFCWYINSSRQQESRKRTYSRARGFLRRYCDSQRGRRVDLLVVSHGFLMRVLARILRKNGFSGPRLHRVRHGFPYIFKED